MFTKKNSTVRFRNITQKPGKEELSNCYNNIRYFQAMETNRPGQENIWDFQNSGLVSPHGSYLHSAWPYESTFRGVLDKAYADLRTRIESELKEKKGQAVGLDVGGIGSQVFKDFSPGFFKKSAGLVLNDTRAIYGVDPADDDSRNHSIIAGNFLEKSTKRRILEWLGGEKADLILERMIGGLKLMPRDLRWIYHAINTLYSLLSDNALMLLQLHFEDDGTFPSKSEAKLITVWTLLINQAHTGKLRAAYDGASLMIRKLQGAPEKLPAL